MWTILYCGIVRRKSPCLYSRGLYNSLEMLNSLLCGNGQAAVLVRGSDRGSAGSDTCDDTCNTEGGLISAHVIILKMRGTIPQ